MKSSPNPTKLFEHIGIHYGFHTQGRAGMTRTAQIEALVPYLDQMDEYAIYTFWDACNKRGWFDLRRKHFDGRVGKNYRRAPVDDTELMAAFDRIIESGHLHWVDREIEQFLGAGSSLDQLMSVLGKWLAARKSFDALRLVAMAMVHAGTRKDLPFLNTAVAPQDAADDLIADTQFAVKRRRLH